MLDWDNAAIGTNQDGTEVTTVALPNNYVTFNIFPKDDYWLVSVQAGSDVIRADDVKYESKYGAKARAETLYSDQWAALCVIDLLGSAWISS